MKNISNSCDIQQQQPCAHAHRFTNTQGLEFKTCNSSIYWSYNVIHHIKKENNIFLKDDVCIVLYIPQKPENSQDNLMNISFIDLWSRKGRFYVFNGPFEFIGDDNTGKLVISFKGRKIESSEMSIHEMIAYTEEKFNEQFALRNVDLVTTQGICFKSISAPLDQKSIAVSLIMDSNIFKSRITIDQFVKLRNTSLDNFGIDLFWELFFMTGYIQINQFHFSNDWSTGNGFMIDREDDKITIYNDDANDYINLCYFDHFNSVEDLMAFSDDDFIDVYGEYDSIAA